MKVQVSFSFWRDEVSFTLCDVNEDVPHRNVARGMRKAEVRTHALNCPKAKVKSVQESARVRCIYIVCSSGEELLSLVAIWVAMADANPRDALGGYISNPTITSRGGG